MSAVNADGAGVDPALETSGASDNAACELAEVELFNAAMIALRCSSGTAFIHLGIFGPEPLLCGLPRFLAAPSTAASSGRSTETGSGPLPYACFLNSSRSMSAETG